MIINVFEYDIFFELCFPSFLTPIMDNNDNKLKKNNNNKFIRHENVNLAKYKFYKRKYEYRERMKYSDIF